MSPNELRALHAAATPGELQAVGYRLSHVKNRNIDFTVEHLDEIGQIGTGPYQAIPFARREDAAWLAAAHNNLIRIVDRLERAELERDAMAHALDVSGFDLGNAQSWLDARDKRMQALGAAKTWMLVKAYAHGRNDDVLARHADEQAARLRGEAEGSNG